MMDDAPPKILIVKLGAVGDVIHTLYPLEVIRRVFPNSRIGWVVEDKSAEILRDRPDIDDLFIFRRKKAGGGIKALGEYFRVIRELRKFSPDIVIDFQALFKSGIFTWASGAKKRIGFDKWREGNFLFTNLRGQSKEEERHAVEKNLALLTLLGLDRNRINNSAKPPQVHLSEAITGPIDQFFTEQVKDQIRVAAINPGASWPTKLWAPQKFGEVVKVLYETENLFSVVIWGPGEKDLARQVVESAEAPCVLAPRTSLRELAWLLSRCDLYLGGDTGPMHLAAIMQTPAVALFAPSDPARVHPWQVPYRIVEPENVQCLHCWEKKHCERNCINEIRVSRVVTAVRSLLKEIRS